MSTIPGLTPITTVTGDDLLITHDNNTGVTGKVSLDTTKAYMFDGFSANSVSYSSGSVGSQLDHYTRVISTVSALSTTTGSIGDKVYVLGHTIAGIGGGEFIAKSSTGLVNDSAITVINGSIAWVKQNTIITPKDFGATPGNDATTAINNYFYWAKNFNNGNCYIDDLYLVSPSVHAGVPGTFGANSVCINLLSGLKIHGPGGFKLRGGTGGASGAVLGNWNGTSIYDTVIEVDVDVNRATSTGTMSGIVIVGGVNCHVYGRGRKIIGASFNGVQFAVVSTGCSCVDRTVDDIGYIGIQAQKAIGVDISRNTVTNCTDNGIDCESNNGTTKRTKIQDNTVFNVNCGVFLESGGNAIVSGNHIEKVTDVSIIMNQINTPSNENLIYGNILKRGGGVGVIGIKFVNNLGYTSVHSNRLDGWDYSFFVDIGTHITIGLNNHTNIAKQIFGITRASNKLLYSKIYEQVLETPRNFTTGYPFTCSPINNPNNFADRDVSCTVLPMWRIEENLAANAVDDEYIRANTTTATNSSWGGVYANFTEGETAVYIPTNNPVVGEVVFINGLWWEVYGFAGGGPQEPKVRPVGGSNGNYTSSLNALYPVKVYYTVYKTD